jgi:hypothetical protein
MEKSKHNPTFAAAVSHSNFPFHVNVSILE